MSIKKVEALLKKYKRLKRMVDPLKAELSETRDDIGKQLKELNLDGYGASGVQAKRYKSKRTYYPKEKLVEKFGDQLDDIKETREYESVRIMVDKEEMEVKNG